MLLKVSLAHIRILSASMWTPINAHTGRPALRLMQCESRDSSVRLIFLEFSPAINTIISQTLVNKLLLWGLKRSLCSWVLDFLTNISQCVKIHGMSSSTSHSTLALHRDVSSAARCTQSLIGLIYQEYNTSNNKYEYRQEVNEHIDWCRANNLCINVGKTKEMVVDLRRSHSHP